jgi:membrane-associated phospholipid phosphatase
MQKSILLIFIVLIYSDCSSQSKISFIYANDSTSKIHQNKNSFDSNCIDVKLFRTINNSRANFKDAVIPVIDQTMLLTSLILPPSLYLYGLTKKDNYLENTGFLLAISEITNSALTFSIKIMVNRPRPYATLKNVYHKEKAKIDKYSFPSGHTSTTFCISTLIALRYPEYPQFYVPLYAWSILIGYGRMYLGMHYPSDVLGGAVVGSLSSILIFSLRKDILRIKNQILSENKEDVSQNSNIIGIYCATFIINEIINNLILNKNKKLKINTYTDLTTLNSIKYNFSFNF